MISFIIPAFNEQAVIADTLKNITIFAPRDEFEVILVDNGSTDDTASIATNLGAKVVACGSGTIAAVRNYGVKHSRGDILVFIDADVLLTESWQKHIQAQITELRRQPMLVTGSRCHPPKNKNWFNVHWYKYMTNQHSGYINSGHLITSKTLFDKIGGFTESLRTAEDHDFCVKAKSAGAEIIPNFELITIHDGYPKTLKQFVQRERWHGREDFESLGSIATSKVALVAVFNLTFAALALISSLILLSPIGIIVYLLAMFVISQALTTMKFKTINFNLLSHTSLIHFCYFWGRSFAFIDRLTGKHTKRFRE